ncbi:prepilin-type N-terminal cleavage/methylation domain-containing protein [Trichlorobacter ammonificans]|uniref:Prepilin-type N-terminal cleavage/methylation domain-containing protein n=1 Tax=Trichlorobacter ammonificans TaxID=2916410 RepID=A0ABM9D7A2_9BACT|nr:prepilin-type N-terminal cleavage/methylation domain-containing protein [Trichlorobacter ammonificans]CAH2031092.1 conserved protein of unknown function [Trichlorobacter ammonificans]
MRRTCSDTHGFTLVELLVVLAVLAVLALMAVQVLNSYVVSVKVGRTSADIRTIEKTLAAYYIEKNQYPASLKDVGMGEQSDPWMNLYEYRLLAGGVEALEDSLGIALNTDYDLYSKGPDGVSAIAAGDASALDDIVRANDGQYAGPRTKL